MRKISIFLTAVFVFSASLFAVEIEEKLSALKINPSNDVLKQQIAEIIKKNPSMIEIALKDLHNSSDPSYICSLSAAISISGLEKAQKEMAKMILESGSDIKSCLTRASGESKNTYAQDALASIVEDFLFNPDRSGERDIKKKIAAIDSIWALGEIGSASTMKLLEKYYNASDEIIRINIIFSMYKIKSDKVLPYLNKIASNELENEAVRSAAYEMIDELEGK